LRAALRSADGDVWVIGGAAVYAEALPLADRVVRTVVDIVVDDGDTHAPKLGADWQPVGRVPASGWQRSSGGLRYAVTTYERTAGTV
jgi:dihydrofolate reductase